MPCRKITVGPYSKGTFHRLPTARRELAGGLAGGVDSRPGASGGLRIVSFFCAGCPGGALVSSHGVATLIPAGFAVDSM